MTHNNQARPLSRVDPFIGLLGTVAGLALCLIFMPEYPYPIGQLAVPAAIFAGGLFLAPLLSIHRNFLSIIQAENILMLALIYWLLLDLIEGAYPLYNVSRENITIAFVMIAVFAVGIWIGSGLFTSKRRPKTIDHLDSYQPRADQVFGFVVFCFFAGMLWYVYSCSFELGCLWDSLAGSRFNKPWWRVKLGGWRAFIEHTRYFGYLLPALTMLLWHLRGRMNWQVICSLIFSAIFVIYISRGGSRRIVGAVLGAGIVTWALLKSRMNYADILKFVIACALLLALLEMLYTYRKIGLEHIFTDYTPPEETNSGLVGGDTNFLRLAQTIDIVPEQHDYVYHQQLVWVLVRPIPRALWPGKPTGPGFFLLYELRYFPESIVPPEYYHRTLTKSIVGDWYIVAGWFTVLLGGLFSGYLASLVNILLFYGRGTVTRLVYGLAMMPMVVGVRAMQELVLMSYPIIALLGLMWLRRFVQGKRLARPQPAQDTVPPGSLDSPAGSGQG